MGYSAAVFANAILKGLGGEHQEAFAYVESNQMPGLSFFSSKITLGPTGIEAVHGFDVNDYEKSLMGEVVSGVKGSIEKGVNFVRSKM